MVLRREGRSFVGSLNAQIFNNCMMANYERLTQLLEHMQYGEHVRRVEAELENFAEDPLIVNLLAMAVADRFLSHNTKLAAAVTLNRTITEHYHEFEEPMMIEQLLRLLFDFSIDFKYKHALHNSFVALIELAEGHTIQNIFAVVAQVGEGIDREAVRGVGGGEESMEERAGNGADELKKVHMIFYIYRCVLEAGGHVNRLFEEVQSTLPTFLTLVPASPDPDNVSTLFRMADFLAAFIERVNESSNEMMNQYGDWLCDNSQLLKWILRVYAIRGVNQQCWLSLEVEPHPEELNDLKAKVTELHHGLLSFLQSFELDDREIVQQHVHASRMLVNTLTAYSGCYRQLFAFEGFVTGLVKSFVKLYEQRRETFSTIYTTLLHQTVFPLLAAKEEELQLFQENPEEFNRLSEDCCDHQRFGVLKTDVAMLLETICDNNDEGAKYVVQHCILSLKVRLALDENFEAQAPNFLPTETALLVLSIQSYKLSKFEDELQELKRILLFPHVQGRLSPLELTRLFAFLAYNYSELYRNGLEGEEWVRLALASDQHRTVEIAALDFITNVVEDYFTIGFLRDFATRTLAKGSLHLNAFIKMLTVHMCKIEETDMVAMADVLLRLIAREIEQYLRRDRPHTIELGNCLHMVRKLLEKDSYSGEKLLLRQKLWQVVELMAELQRVHLDDELVRIITCFLNKQHALTPQLVAIIQPVIQLYQMDRLDCVAYLVFFNQVIMKGHASVAAHVGTMLVTAFLRIKDQGLGEQRVTKWKVAIGTLCLLMQNILAFHGNDVPAALIEQFAALALTIIPLEDNPEDKFDSVLVARSLNLLFLCHMNQRNEVALRRLLVFQESGIFHSYDLRVLCLCLAKEVLRESDVVAVTEMINLMVKAIAAARMPPTTIVAKKNPLSIKSSSTRIRIKRIEDYEYILKFMVTPFRESHPEAELQQVIETMKVNNAYLYQGIVKSLPRVVYEKLKEQMTEVVIDGKKRRIVHAGPLKDNGKLPNETIIARGPKKRTFGSEDEDEEDQEDYSESKRRNMQKKKMNEEVKRKENGQ